jgi:E3 ubiquitin-protein ligase TRIP12
VFETEGLAALRKTAARLSSDPEAVIKLLQLLAGPASASPSSGAGSTEKGAPGAVTKSSSLLRRSFNSGLPSSGSGAISVFELVNSGAVKVLSDYLQGNDIPAGPGHEQALLQRLRAFVNAALSPDSGANPPMLALVRKLAGALASMETFPVICSRLAPGPSASGGSSMSRYGYDAGSFSRGGSASYSASMGAAGGSNPLSSGLAALTHPFKLRLCRHTNERNLRDYGSNVVLIEPLASMSAIEDFLWPRVNRGPSSGGTSAGAGGGTAGTAGTGTTAAAAGTTAGAPGTTTAAGAAGARGTAAAPGSGIGNTAAGTTSAGQPSATTATRSGVMSGLRAALASATERAAALASAAAAASKAQPIPEEAGGTNRRVTRSAAAAAAAAAANDKAKGNDARSGGAAKGQVSSAVDAPAGPPGAAAGEDDEDAAMHEDDYGESSGYWGLVNWLCMTWAVKGSRRTSS